ncbi:hypothetical protein Dimus_032063 [Dionaea muscipula]
MSARVPRVATPRGTPRNPHKGKIVLGVDLNVSIHQTPIDEGTSSCPSSHEVPAVQLGGSQQLTLIDVDSIDDDVVVSSASAFAEAKNKSRRNRGGTIVDIDSEDSTRCGANNRNKRRRVPPNQPIINCETYANLTSANSMRYGMRSVETMLLPPLPPSPPPPPKEPTFSCPVCMGSLVEETSTKCGHIFCKACIKAAITAQKKCPTCRRKATMKDIIRVYLPSTN